MKKESSILFSVIPNNFIVEKILTHKYKSLHRKQYIECLKEYNNNFALQIAWMEYDLHVLETEEDITSVIEKLGYEKNHDGSLLFTLNVNNDNIDEYCPDCHTFYLTRELNHRSFNNHTIDKKINRFIGTCQHNTFTLSNNY